MSIRFSCAIPLPASFRAGDILAFHRRDAQEIAERVTASSLHKGLLWADAPACLSIHLAADMATAELDIDDIDDIDDSEGSDGINGINGNAATSSEAAFQAMLRRMLGLTQDVEQFASRYHQHPQLGPLIAGRPGLRVPLTATPFEALTWAITGQQISVRAAVSVRRKLIVATGLRHSSGLFCYPEARQIAALSEDDLRRAGFSMSKTRSLRSLAQGVRSGKLPLAAWLTTLPIDEIREQLLGVPGIGPWTVNYALLRGFGNLDGSLHGDVAVRRKLQALLASPEKISEAQARDWLAPFTPWRALVAAHLWAMPTPA
jgi:DNA-3-methyladenine glycosylase II